jgi:hypothetical protein
MSDLEAVAAVEDAQRILNVHDGEGRGEINTNCLPCFNSSCAISLLHVLLDG